MWAVNASVELSPSAFRVLLIVANLADDCGVAECSYSQLEQLTGLSRSTVRRSTRELDEAGVMVANRAAGGSRRTPQHLRPTVYRLPLVVGAPPHGVHSDHSPLPSVVRMSTPFTCDDEKSDHTYKALVLSPRGGRGKPLRGSPPPRGGGQESGTPREGEIQMGWNEMFKSTSDPADDDGNELGGVGALEDAARMDLDEYLTQGIHRFPGESNADYSRRRTRQAPRELVFSGTDRRRRTLHDTPENKWNAGHLVSYFRECRQREAPGFVAQENVKIMGANFKRWLTKEGVDPREIRAGIDLFFADPRNLAHVGAGASLWSAFFKAWPALQRQARVASGIEADRTAVSVEEADAINTRASNFFKNLLEPQS